MGCGSSKTLESDITKTQRIEIIPRDGAPNGDVLFIKPTNLPNYSRSISDPPPNKSTPDLSTSHSRAPLRSPGSTVQSLGKKRLSKERKKRSSSVVIKVEPQTTASIQGTPEARQRQISASSRVTADSGFGEGSRAGVSAESSRAAAGESEEFVTELSLHSHTEVVRDTERPATPDLLIEGISCLPPLKRTTTFSKLANLSGTLDNIHPSSADNITEKAPLPPIHSNTNRHKFNLAGDQLNSPTMELEQNLDIVERPSSRGGMAFDVLLGVPRSKKQALAPIEFDSEKIPGNNKRRSTEKLTKESIDAKLAAAEKRRKEREQEIIKNLVEQREIDERKMKEQYERYKEKIGNKEVNIGERMRTTSVNRDAQISAKVSQAQREKEKVENVRQARKSNPLNPQDGQD